MTATPELLPAPPSGACVELLAAPDSLLALAESVARRASASASATRATYATTYRAFAAFLAARLRRTPGPGDLTETAVADYRDTLEHAGRARATVAKELSALHRLAAALRAAGADPSVDRVRANTVARRRATSADARRVRAAAGDARSA